MSIADTAPPQDAQDRTDRFMAKVEAELASLPPTERLPWLQRQRKLWIIMFNRFVYRADEGLAPEFGAPAEDYELTITALGQRIALEERRLAVVPVA